MIHLREKIDFSYFGFSDCFLESEVLQIVFSSRIIMGVFFFFFPLPVSSSVLFLFWFQFRASPKLFSSGVALASCVC